MPEVPAICTSGFCMSNGFSWHLLHLTDKLRVSGTLRPSAHLLWPGLSTAETPPHPTVVPGMGPCPGTGPDPVVVFRAPYTLSPQWSQPLSDTYLLTASACPRASWGISLVLFSDLVALPLGAALLRFEVTVAPSDFAEVPSKA